MKANRQSNILLVEDDIRTARLYNFYLKNEPINLIHVDTGQDALKYLQEIVPQILLIDLGLPDMNGIDIVKHVKKNHLDCILIVITAEDSIDVVVDTMRNGVFDFIKKPFLANRLVTTLRQVIKIHHSRSCFIPPKTQNFIGNSSSMQDVYQTIERVAKSKASVFITGETGTGKELCAQEIHKTSQRWDKPFIVLNCASIVRDLMESELFGHVQGAFTGAEKNREGAVSLADGGTLFLDEIGELDLDLQRKLLRFLQQSTFHKVGSNYEEKVDIRIICATNRNPQIEINNDCFRYDLYCRLNTITIKLPPLHERDEDVQFLAKTFLKKYSNIEQKKFKDFTPKAKQILTEYEWPGNIRQLKNVIHNIVLLNEGTIVTSEILLAKLESELFYNPTNKTEEFTVIEQPNNDLEPISPDTVEDSIRPLHEIEKEMIMKAINICGNVVKAAELLGISKSNIYKKRKAWNKEANVNS